MDEEFDEFDEEDRAGDSEEPEETEHVESTKRREPNFLEKYGPFIRILETGDEDYEYLAAKPGYTSAVGRDFRKMYFNVIKGYMRSIRTDFEVLYQQTAARALMDEQLGELLGDLEARLKRIERRVRMYLFLQKFTPLPGNWPHRSAARVLMSTVMPKNTAKEIRDLFSVMLAIHRTYEVRVFLP
jgi:hypothetical protein